MSRGGSRGGARGVRGPGGPGGPGGRGPGGPGGPGKFLLVSISRKMKGEKIAICWPKSWANRFPKIPLFGTI